MGTIIRPPPVSENPGSSQWRRYRIERTATVTLYGVGEQSLRKWHARLAPKPEPCGENASLDELRVGNQRLRRELRRAEMEREILKKVAPGKSGKGGSVMRS